MTTTSASVLLFMVLLVPIECARRMEKFKAFGAADALAEAPTTEAPTTTEAIWDGWCRNGSNQKGVIGAPDAANVDACKQACGTELGCTAYSWEVGGSVRCFLYQGGPYTKGSGRANTKCYIFEAVPTNRPGWDNTTMCDLTLEVSIGDIQTVSAQRQLLDVQDWSRYLLFQTEPESECTTQYVATCTDGRIHKVVRCEGRPDEWRPDAECVGQMPPHLGCMRLKNVFKVPTKGAFLVNNGNGFEPLTSGTVSVQASLPVVAYYNKIMQLIAQPSQEDANAVEEFANFLGGAPAPIYKDPSEGATTLRELAQAIPTPLDEDLQLVISDILLSIELNGGSGPAIMHRLAVQWKKLEVLESATDDTLNMIGSYLGEVDPLVLFYMQKRRIIMNKVPLEMPEVWALNNDPKWMLKVFEDFARFLGAEDPQAIGTNHRNVLETLLDLVQSKRRTLTELSVLGLSTGAFADDEAYLTIVELLLQKHRSSFGGQLLAPFKREQQSRRRLALDIARVNMLQKSEMSLEKTTKLRGFFEEKKDDFIDYNMGLLRAQEDSKLMNEGETKEQALIFTCSMGGGHKSAALAVSQYLSDGGLITSVVDTTHDKRFRHRLSAVSDYWFNDIILKDKNYHSYNVYNKSKMFLSGKIHPLCAAPACDNRLKKAFRSAILVNRPSLIVTVYHMDLLYVLELAKELGNLPLLHLATDMDCKMSEVFGSGLRGLFPVYSRFKVAMPFNVPQSRGTLAPLEKSQWFLSGYPVRDAFLQTRTQADCAKLKASYVEQGTKVVLVMTGGGGQDVPWPEMLAKNGIGERMHIFVVAAGNNGMEQRLQEALPRQVMMKSQRYYATGPSALWAWARDPKGSRERYREVMQGVDQNVTVEVVRDPENELKDKPFFVGGDYLALLMDISDVIITKPGGGSTAEVAYRGVPAVFDGTSGYLHWEEFTVKVFVQQGRGKSLTNPLELQNTIKEAMQLGRNTIIAQDPQTHALLNTGDIVRAAAEELLDTPCVSGCPLWKEKG